MADSVKFVTYWKYLRAGSGYSVLFLFLLSCIIFQFLYSFFICWLSHWTNAEQQRKNSFAKNHTMQSSNYSSLDDVLNQMDTKTGICGITAITLGLFPFSVLRAVLFFSISLKASINLHDRMFQSVTRAPLFFFQSNSIGILLHFQNIKTKIEYLQFINFFKYRPHFKSIFQRYWKQRRRTSCYVHGPNYSKKYVLYLVNSSVAS